MIYFLRKLLFLVFFAFCSVVSATTYYVAPTGKDSNPGTITQPWATFQHAFDNVIAGDTVYVRGGIYYAPSNGSGSVLTRDGSVGNYISIMNYPGEVPIVDGSNIVSGSYPNGIELVWCKLYSVKRIEVKEYSSDWYW